MLQKIIQIIVYLGIKYNIILHLIVKLQWSNLTLWWQVNSDAKCNTQVRSAMVTAHPPRANA